MTIAIDFDGTCVKNSYPKVGETIKDAIPILQKLGEKHKLILLTMRSGVFLTAAKDWFAENKIKLYAVNDNPNQHSWTKSKKIYADYYIDDQAIGCPCKKDDNNKNYVNWSIVKNILTQNGVL